MGNDELLQALLNKLAGIITGKNSQDEKPSTTALAQSTDNYLAWCRPGIPFQPEDLQFAVKGFTGANAEESKNLVRSAAAFARVANLIPNANSIGRNFEGGSSMIWDVYKNVLKLSKVAHSELTQEQKDKIKKFRDLMVVTKKVKNIVTDVEEEKTFDGPVKVLYNEKKQAYEDALLQYNKVRLNALNGDNTAVQDFALNGSMYLKKVQTALNEWERDGYKNDVEAINAYIAQVSQKDLTLLKNDLLAKVSDTGTLTDPITGDTFYPTFVYPGSFVSGKKGWTDFTFDSKTKDTYSKVAHESTSVSAGLNLGLWKIGANGTQKKDTTVNKLNSTDLSMSFSITQTPIGRPWFSPDFLMNRAWKFDDNSGQNPLSDGNNPPKGQMVAYPTTAIWIKDIKITSSNISEFSEEIRKEVEAGGSVGWGPFSFGRASYKSDSTEKTTNVKVDGNTMTVTGWQLIAFNCFKLPKAPDPVADIKNWA